MLAKYEILSLLSAWINDNTSEWEVAYKASGRDLGDRGWYICSKHFLIPAYEIVDDYILYNNTKLNIADPEFFEKLKKILEISH